MGARYRAGPELEVSGFSCDSHFMEIDMYMHCDQILASILDSDATDNLLCDIGWLNSSYGVTYCSAPLTPVTHVAPLAITTIRMSGASRQRAIQLPRVVFGSEDFVDPAAAHTPDKSIGQVFLSMERQ